MKASRNTRDSIGHENYSILERELKYKFKDKALLIEALTKTVANNTKSSQQQHQKTNERLEFFGDRVLELAVTSILFEQNPKSKKGELNNRVSNLVSNKGTLLDVAKKLNLGEYIIQNGEIIHEDQINDRILADAMEAIIGAIYLDSGENEALIKAFIIRHWEPLKLKPEIEAFKAIEKHNPRLLDGLLKTGVNPNVFARNDNVGKYKFLYDQGSFTLLYIAVTEGKVEMVKALLEAKANPNLAVTVVSKWREKPEVVSSDFPLHKAAFGCPWAIGVRECDEPYIKIISLLIKYGADVNKVNEDNRSAIFVASARGIKTVDKLIKKGADVNISNNEGRSPLHIVADRWSWNNKETAVKLIKAGAEVNKPDNEGLTPLHLAVMRENLEVVRLLIGEGANVNNIDKQGRTPLHYTVLCNTALKNRVVWEIDGTPLVRYAEILKILLKHGADPLIKDKVGCTPKSIINSKLNNPARYDVSYTQGNTTCEGLREVAIKKDLEMHEALKAVEEIYHEKYRNSLIHNNIYNIIITKLQKELNYSYSNVCDKTGKLLSSMAGIKERESYISPSLSSGEEKDTINIFIEFNNQADFALFKLFCDDTYPGLILEYSYGVSDIDGIPVKIKMDAQIFYEKIIPALSEFKQAEELEKNSQIRSFRRSVELSSSSSSDNENCLLM